MFLGWRKGAEGESDGGNSQRKQVGRKRRDWSWTEEVPLPQADRRLEWTEVRVAVARLLDVRAIKRENHGVWCPRGSRETERASELCRALKERGTFGNSC